MWTRAELKNRAKEVLSTTYWKSLLVSIIIAMAGGGGGSSAGSQYTQNNTTGINNYGGYTPYGQYDDMLNSMDWNSFFQENMIYIVIALIVFLIVIAFVLAFRIFLGYPLEVGGRRFFIQSARDDCTLNNIGYAFNKERYFKIIGAMFMKGLFVFLWSLLLVIPGIIASYSYYMVSYILTDNPELGYKKALKLSKEMTRGYKLDIFILELSFIGWYFLSIIPAVIGIINGWYLLTFAAGIGFLFILPYIDATKAQLYLELRKIYKSNGIGTDGEIINN